MSEESVASGPGYLLRFRIADTTAYDALLDRLIADRVASRLSAGDPTLWGPTAEEEAARRLGWIALPRTSRPLVAEILALREDLIARGLDRFVLCGMGGSSLAPEVITTAAGAPLEVLDSSHPDSVRLVVSRDIERTVVIVSSKSGSTVETDSHRRVFAEAFAAAGIDPAERIIIVSDPGSELDRVATADGCRIFRSDPEVGGRYSAHSAFGLVPAGLAGVDIARLLDEGEEVMGALARDDRDNPGLRLGALLGLAASRGIDKLILASAGAVYSGLGDWIEQLIAESTGKQGKGLLPVVVGATDSPNFASSSPDSLLASFGPDFPFTRTGPTSGLGVSIDAGLGAQMQIWEFATAVAGRVLEINPFDQPDVESSKAAARKMLGGEESAPEPRFVEDGIAVHAGDWLPAGVFSVSGAIRALLEQLDPDHGYLAVQAYLDRHTDSSLAAVRAALAARTGRPVTFGWGPRFLHSTGQYHKGGPAAGVYLQVSTEPDADQGIPGRDFSFQDFIVSQAVGDGLVLAEKGRPVLRLHLQDPFGGVPRLRDMLQ
ncbi:glucose-6-phosphate isomerase [Nocardioides sp. AE5]|uniref:glucose-6-phosphate isomerase n=1 Tax=Nocardioides sp. AE5 TaxID=2962573 RepID=UPI0028823660|nr:glucose-6-phosphate isomerase [Nocardioides sp. AE5]MDT0203638.1 glucose-6-phosphate isomerase [Nocardioides sp. AE5]